VGEEVEREESNTKKLKIEEKTQGANTTAGSEEDTGHETEEGETTMEQRGRKKTDRESAEEEATLRDRELGVDTGTSRAIPPIKTLFQITYIGQSKRASVRSPVKHRRHNSPSHQQIQTGST
jgi:hypothetical protein